MEKSKEPSPEDLKQAFMRRIMFLFTQVLKATNQVMILGFLNNLSDSVLAGLAQGFTQGISFDKSEKVKLSAQLNVQKLPEARRQILLEALKGSGLEEEFLAKLRETKIE